MSLKIYSTHYRCKSGLYIVLKELLFQITMYKWQIILSIQKKIKETYQKDVFGVFWTILMPILPMTVYMGLAHIKVFNTVQDMPFVYYIGMGMMVWLLMSTIVRHVMESIKREKVILTTTEFPILVIMISHLGEVLHDTTIRFLAIAIIVIGFKLNVSIFGIVAALLSLIPAIIMAFALGVILSILDVVIQDTRRIVYIFLRYGLFVSSVIFAFPTEGMLGTIIQFNFFNTYINATRELLFYGQLTNIITFTITSISSVILLLLAFKVLYSLEYKIRAYL